MKDIREKQIEKHFANEAWAKARVIILKWLKNEPHNHWLLSQLALTYYEEKDYKKAKGIERKALQLAPNCPLLNWNYAGTLDMLGYEKEAIEIWKNLIKRGLTSIAYDECGEGLPWARSLLNDCLYRIGLSYASLGKKQLSIKYIQQHIEKRGSNCKSIYNLREVKKRLRKIKEP